VLVLIGVFATPLILQLTAAGLPPDVIALAIKLTRIIFPGVGLLVLYAWALGILNTHRQFFIGYVAPVLWSAAMIATMLIFGMRMRGASLATALAWGTLIGCALQFAIEIPFVLRHANHLSFGFDRTLEPVRTIFRRRTPPYSTSRLPIFTSSAFRRSFVSSSISDAVVAAVRRG
jgi:putative peptidoglycan lipid II flippase